MANSVGILGVGMYLPPKIRRNDWWPQQTVARWMADRKPPPKPPLESLTEGARRVVAAMSKQALDPFQGAVERHVMDPGASVFDMGAAAGRDAIARSGIDASKIDLILTHTLVPDVLAVNSACPLHHRIGLSRECFALETEGATYSFLSQLQLAHAMIASGQAHYALLVQSCATSPLVDYDDAWSPVYGDGATAVVVGPVGEGRGILGAVNYTDGRVDRNLGIGVSGGRWYDAARSTLVIDQGQMGQLLLGIADVIKESVDAVLARAGLAASEVDFFCMHQGTPWLRDVVLESTGLTHTKSVETFSRTGYLFSAILPSGLDFAEREGILDDGNLVLLAAGGTGMTNGAMLLRWGQ